MFLFIPYAPHVLLQYHASSVVLPAIAKGSLSTMTALHNCHPYELFKLYNQCSHVPSPLLQSLAKQKLSDLCFKFFKVCPTRIMLFSIKQNEILSRNKIKLFSTPFLKHYPFLRTCYFSSNLKLKSRLKVTQKYPHFFKFVTILHGVKNGQKKPSPVTAQF